MRPMVGTGCHVRLSRAVGAEFIGYDRFGSKSSIALHLRHQHAPTCRRNLRPTQDVGNRMQVNVTTPKIIHEYLSYLSRFPK